MRPQKKFIERIIEKSSKDYQVDIPLFARKKEVSVLLAEFFIQLYLLFFDDLVVVNWLRFIALKNKIFFS